MIRATTTIFCLAILCLAQAHAHVAEMIFLRFENKGGGDWTAEVFFDAGYALPEMRADKESIQPSREWLTQRSEKEWKRMRQGSLEYLSEMIEFSIIPQQGDVQQAAWSETFPDFKTSPPDFPVMPDGCAYMRVTLTGNIKEGLLRIGVRDGDYPSLTIARGAQYDAVIPGSSLAVMDVAPGVREAIARDVERKNGWLPRAIGFLKLGFAHVLPDGADHVLFILALFLYAPRWKPLLHQSLLFTLAHSLTLGLMLAGVVNANPAIIEPIIALSIAWVAVEYLVLPGEPGWRRLGAVFAFGLVHGLGFASSLRTGLMNEGEWVLPLIAANIGIEVAQVLILASCLIVFFRFTNQRWFTHLRKLSALIIGCIGLWWFIERLASS